jgi:hypothetical protein
MAKDSAQRERTGVIRIELRPYRKWQKACHLTNGVVELVVLLDAGPRVLHFGLCGGENQFHEFADQDGLRGGNEFRLYGGHRLWVWPETERTYYPDNSEVQIESDARGARFIAPPEFHSPGASLRKSMRLELDETGSRVRVTHSILNTGSVAAEFAPWAPTVLRPGGRAILPLPARHAMDKEHFQSVAPMTLWAFTDFTDSRWIIGREFLQLVQQSKPQGLFSEQMSGLFVKDGWGAYVRSDIAFVKRARPVLGARYPDFGCNFEIFTNPEFLELETLGPVATLAPGKAVEHAESWWLYEGNFDLTGEDEIRQSILPLIAKTEMP